MFPLRYCRCVVKGLKTLTLFKDEAGETDTPFKGHSTEIEPTLNLNLEIKMRGPHVRLGAIATCVYHINLSNSTMIIVMIAC